MRRLLLGVVLCLLLVPASGDARNWERVVLTVEQSIVRFDMQFAEEFASCTGWSIDAVRGHFMTALHCYQPEPDLVADHIRIGDEPARLLWISETLDVAIFSANLHRPTLPVRHSRIGIGKDIGVLGFGYGFPYPLFVSGNVAASGIDLPGAPKAQHWFFANFPYIQGMSGAPVFNSNGEVVGIAQSSNYAVGWGRVIDPIFKASRHYWAEP